VSLNNIKHRYYRWRKMAEMREGMNLPDISVLFGVSYLFFCILKYVCHVIIRKFTFAISSPDEFLVNSLVKVNSTLQESCS